MNSIDRRWKLSAVKTAQASGIKAPGMSRADVMRCLWNITMGVPINSRLGPMPEGGEVVKLATDTIVGQMQDWPVTREARAIGIALSTPKGMRCIWSNSPDPRNEVQSALESGGALPMGWLVLSDKSIYAHSIQTFDGDKNVDGFLASLAKNILRDLEAA